MVIVLYTLSCVVGMTELVEIEDSFSGVLSMLEASSLVDVVFCWLGSSWGAEVEVVLEVTTFEVIVPFGSSSSSNVLFIVLCSSFLEISVKPLISERDENLLGVVSLL
ncbi:MAG TPA: hypothetical protein VLX29_05040, partial [Nitrospirota bacterium]|nr:hypothetical protein [Nitrospirota bacterium]